MNIAFSNAIRRTALLVVAATAAIAACLAFSVDARAIDTDGNGYHDALVRESPYVDNVGARCDVFYSYGWKARITVRPPRMWSLWNQSNQQVAWKVRAMNLETNALVSDTNWTYSTASPNQATDFGGSTGPYLTSPSYWTASKSVDFSLDSMIKVYALVDVAWQDARNGGWVVRTLRVNRYFHVFNNLVQYTSC